MIQFTTNMRTIAFLPAVAALSLPGAALATGETGRIEVCRHPGIVEQTNKFKVALQAPIRLAQPDRQAGGTTGQIISVSEEITLGPKPSCAVATGTVADNPKGLPPPKKGSIWEIGAEAKPGQYWGKPPKVKRVKVGEQYVEVEETSPSQGGPIQYVTVRGRVLEDFK